MLDSPLAIVAKYQTKAPVDLNAISRDLGLKVYIEPLGRNIAGMLMNNPSKGGPSGFSIHINSTEHPNRQRFTHAHELAHFILHRDLIESGLVDDTMYRSQLSDYYEVQANRMAADILMPVRLVKAYRVDNFSPETLAALFGVSLQAMKIRLDNIESGAVNRPT